MLQALLDGGDVLRVQGYLSFLPAGVERQIAAGAHAGSVGSGAPFPPPFEEAWALPMVTVEGIFRGRLQVQAVEAAHAPGDPARRAEAAGQPWQETALEAAAADRGGSKLFLCGKGLDDRALRRQLARTASLGFGAEPVCDLEDLAPAAAQALAKVDEAVATALQAGLSESLSAPGSCRSGATAGRPCLDTPGQRLARERAAAEAFGQRLAEALQEALPPSVAAEGMGEPLEAPVHWRRGRGPAQAAVLRWAAGVLSLRAVPAPAPLAVAQRPEASAALRLCVDTARAGETAGAREEQHPLEVLVVGTEVFCR